MLAKALTLCSISVSITTNRLCFLLMSRLAARTNNHTVWTSMPLGNQDKCCKVVVAVLSLHRCVYSLLMNRWIIQGAQIPVKSDPVLTPSVWFLWLPWSHSKLRWHSEEIEPSSTLVALTTVHVDSRQQFDYFSLNSSCCYNVMWYFSIIFTATEGYYHAFGVVYLATWSPSVTLFVFCLVLSAESDSFRRHLIRSSGTFVWTESVSGIYHLKRLFSKSTTEIKLRGRLGKHVFKVFKKQLSNMYLMFYVIWYDCSWTSKTFFNLL